MSFDALISRAWQLYEFRPRADESNQKLGPRQSFRLDDFSLQVLAFAFETIVILTETRVGDNKNGQASAQECYNGANVHG